MAGLCAAGEFFDDGRLLNQFGKVTIALGSTIQGITHLSFCKNVIGRTPLNFLL